ADLARRHERRTQHHDYRRKQIHHVPVDEIERIETEPRRDWRTCGERQNDAGEHHHQQRGEHRPVDGSPPGSEQRTARDHAVLNPFRYGTGHRPRPALAVAWRRIISCRTAYAADGRHYGSQTINNKFRLSISAPAATAPGSL